MAAKNQQELELMHDWDVTQTEDYSNAMSHKHTVKPYYRKWVTISRVLFNIFCLAWIIPITILLVLNFKSSVVGAGVGCQIKSLKSDCYLDLLGIDDFDQSKKATDLDKMDHTILGGLQFVAKALEIWFSIIAASLVYDLTLLLAARSEGFPVRYLLTHAEFGDILTLFNRMFWGSSKLWRRRERTWLLVFLVFVALLCITCNLMGPATAVLVIPTLKWSPPPTQSVQQRVQQRLGQVAAPSPPTNPTIASGCNASFLAAGNFTCANYYSPALDKYSSTILFAYQEIERGGYYSSDGVLGESGLSFTYNATSGHAGPINWVPNRQVLREVSNDYIQYQFCQGANMTFDEARSNVTKWNRTLTQGLFDSYRNSLGVVLHRTGPSIGLAGYCSRANVTEIALTQSKSVRCYYFNASLDGDYDEFRCIRAGSGWNEIGLRQSEFSIGDTDIHSTGNVSVTVYSATESIDLTSSTIHCVTTKESNDSCDWDLMFSNKTPSDVTYFAESQQLIEYNLPLPQATNATVACTSSANYTIANYSIEISPNTNSIGLVSLIVPSDEDQLSQVISLNPDWILAAWAVPRSGTVDGNRAAAWNLIRTLKTAVSTSPPATLNFTSMIPDPGLDPFSSQQIAASLHALSIIDYTTDQDPSHRPLPVSQNIRVWAYGHDSRTFKVGLVVTIFGFLCVLLRVAIGITMSIRRRSTLEFLMAAMKYPHRGEFDDLGEAESEFGQVLIKLKYDNMGRMEFTPLGVSKV